MTQWSADWYADGYPEGPARDPKGPTKGDAHVIRGASWLSMPSSAAARMRGDPDFRSALNGFRCAQSAAQ